MIQYISISISGLTLIGVYYVAFIQEKRLKSLERFINIFDIEKIEKFVKLNEKSSNLEMEILKKDFKINATKTMEAMQSVVDIVKQIPVELKKINNNHNDI